MPRSAVALWLLHRSNTPPPEAPSIALPRTRPALPPPRAKAKHGRMSARIPLSYPAHARALLALGLPLIGSNLAQMLLHVTDTVMLGWYGVNALAAVVLGSSAFFIVFILGSGFGIAVLGLVSSAVGAGDTTQVRRDTRMGLWLSAGYGLSVMPLMWWSGPILLAAGQKPEVAALAQDYLRIAGFGMVPALSDHGAAKATSRLLSEPMWCWRSRWSASG